MPRTLLGGIAIASIAAVTVVAAPQQPSSSISSGLPHRAVLDRYCVTCHNDRLRTAALSLETIDVARVAERLSTVLRYRGQYGTHESTAKLLLKLGARPMTQEELDARVPAAR